MSVLWASNPQEGCVSLLVVVQLGNPESTAAFIPPCHPSPFVVTLLGNYLSISHGMRFQLLGKPPPAPGKDSLSWRCHLQWTPGIKYVLHSHCTASHLQPSFLQNRVNWTMKHWWKHFLKKSVELLTTKNWQSTRKLLWLFFNLCNKTLLRGKNIINTEYHYS